MENKDYSAGINLIAQTLDVAGVCLISFIVHRLYLSDEIFSREYLISLILTSLLALFTFPRFGIYQSWRGRSKFVRAQVIISAWFLTLSSLIILSVILKNTSFYSRVWFFTWGAISGIYLIVIRHIMDQILNHLRSKGWNHKNIIVFGAGQLGLTVAEKLHEADWTGFKIKAFFDDDANKISKKVSNVEVHDAKDILHFLTSNDIKEIWIALPLKNEEKVKSLLHELRHLTIAIKYVPDIFGFRILNQKTTEIAGIPVMQLNTSPMDGTNLIIKAIEDKVLSFIILCLISPIMLIIAIAIKLESKGPIFFKQKRHGWNGKEINVYKFRSMKVHDEKQGKITQAKKNDSRITKVGAFIRKTSLDELPQFINVLQGRMSIVGPRPHALAHNEEYKEQVDYYMQRHRVKPGITGWAQINGYRGETDTLDKMSKRVEFDLYYIENWSLFLDLKIIFLTIFKGFIHKNAY